MSEHIALNAELEGQPELASYRAYWRLAWPVATHVASLSHYQKLVTTLLESFTSLKLLPSLSQGIIGGLQILCELFP